ncbi:leucyl aminopeptidase [Legionella sp. CNM-4043-24]|uniref:leucyl aminopeptidase n=1 Tax=Legionella sp. CNM-4043-24 TaxID=3421646 RepID=UPI00403B3093
MHYGLIQTPPTQASECLVFGVFSDRDTVTGSGCLQHQQQELIHRLAGRLQENGDSLWHYDADGSSLYLLHCGKEADFDQHQLRKRLSDVCTALLRQRIKSAVLCLPQIQKQDADWQLTQMLLQVDAHCYQTLDFKTLNKKPHALESVQFCLAHASKSSLEEAEAVADGVRLTRHLADLPANRCTPSYLADQARELSKTYSSIKTRIFDKDEMREMGMGSLLAVAQGSIEPPCLIEMRYDGGGNSAPFVLVGKGITFDSGGLSLKPANSMDEMKYDMAGAASVLGTMQACAQLKLPVNLIGLIASAENMPSGSAVKPGDIVNSMSGQSIEILNTDAEGRLVLADALTYAERFNPAWVIDIATLTGAVIVALGTHTSGLMTTDEELARDILNASEASADACWRLPLTDVYQDAIDSPMADMINAGFDRSAGSITAACFLSRFTKKYRWAHLDIAGTAWVSGKKRQATGRPVPLLVQMLRHANTR